MPFSISKYKEIKDFIKKQPKINGTNNVKIIAVTKTMPVSDINESIKWGVRHFGEIKVQEAVKKFLPIKSEFNDINLHMIGKLQTNKVKKAIEIFDYFHSLDRDSLAIEFSKYKNSVLSKSFFIQVNTGLEKQKSGIDPNHASDFIQYALNDLELNIIGLMCIPPVNDNPKEHFDKLSDLALQNNLQQLSIGMSGDYKVAIACGATFIRIGSSLFGQRKQK